MHSRKHALAILAITTCLLGSGPAAAQNLPQSINDLGLKNIEVREKPRVEYGRRIQGTLPSNASIEIELDGKDRIEDIEARGGKLFPAADIRTLIPASVLQNQQWP